MRWHYMERTSKGQVYSIYNTDIAVVDDPHNATVYLDGCYDTITDGENRYDRLCIDIPRIQLGQG